MKGLTMERKASSKSSTSGSQGASNDKSKGQKRSSERGTATSHKKNPGSRAQQGGSSR
jgi:hypothetical protein